MTISGGKGGREVENTVSQLFHDGRLLGTFLPGRFSRSRDHAFVNLCVICESVRWWTARIHDFANVTLAMPDGFDRVAPSPSWGHRVVSNNKQKFNNEVECKMCSK